MKLLKDLKNNTYYTELENRLTNAYPEAPYTKQYLNEINSDRYMVSASKDNTTGFDWDYITYVLLGISVLINLILFFKKRPVSSTSPSKKLREDLSKQERVVLDLILQNKTNKEIADTLFLSVSTVKTHTNNIYKKLNVNSRDEAKSLFFK